MPVAAESAVVRLCGWSAASTTAGLGLLVGADRVVTCAHVVNAALGRGLLEQDRPDGPVLVEFPLLPAMPVRLARVVAWAPPRGWDGGDVAGLALSESAPAGAVPVQLAAAPRECCCERSGTPVVQPGTTGCGWMRS
jgi:hypothetical protein